MADDHKVNAQIVDSVADVVTLSAGIAPAHGAAMLEAILSETLGMAMYNAVSRQQSSSTIGSAATTSACAKMLSVPIAPPRPAPLPPPAPTNPELALILAATKGARDAITTLQDSAKTPGVAGDLATAYLVSVATEAVYPRPAAAVPPPQPPAPSLAGSDDADTLDIIFQAYATASAALSTLQDFAPLQTFSGATARTSLSVLHALAEPQPTPGPTPAPPPPRPSRSTNGRPGSRRPTAPKPSRPSRSA
jgi:hypothetical protein